MISGREEGAGTVMALAVAAAVIAVFGLLAPIAVVLEAQHRVAAAADAAALAAGDTALGMATGVPCGRASEVADAAHVLLDACAQRGDLVRVRTRAEVLGLALTAVAVAGPPADEG